MNCADRLSDCSNRCSTLARRFVCQTEFSESHDERHSDGVEVDEEEPLDAPSLERLREAVVSVPEKTLREIVLDLIEDMPSVGHALFKELVTVQHGELVQRWEICRKCGDDFDVSATQVEGSCQFHPGVLEVREEEFVDWDEDCHGPMDTPENRRDYPENFSWTCCDGSGLSEGCVSSTHTASGPARKRKRI
ncbi:hypothetical protein PUNSTDRAFT_77150 [Punctularia strigosozonata HHB-11173 SS5]|uniref:C2H2-type domain-containing protein n=1 Tax=Punctularia strigosozonata (strain HHB-11173) TaxID=741275 RepID=R7S1F1_PUNST|nr:uncharacterized protein PUNSTDRAFT_77150 [Punctularia strigosozonata HHB-11173 SS5]EIN04053.1 hypothetical protein PUNSTDRAFT_77150 [Punctularia strigosozonata HHB-11173 SS5]